MSHIDHSHQLDDSSDEEDYRVVETEPVNERYVRVGILLRTKHAN